MLILFDNIRERKLLFFYLCKCWEDKIDSQDTISCIKPELYFVEQ